MLRWILIMGWVVAVAFVGISAVINALFLSSLGRTPLEASVFATLSAVADSAKAILPVLILAAWRNGHRKAASVGGAVLTALVGLSVMSGMGFAAMTRSAVASAQALAGLDVRMTTDAIVRGEASRAALGPVRPKIVVEQEQSAAMADRLWGLSQSCAAPTGRQQREFCGRVTRLRGELAAATAAGAIEADLQVLRVRLAALRERGTTSTADPQVAAVAELLGATPLAVRLAMTLGLAVVIELGAVAFILIVAAATSARRSLASTEKPAEVSEARPAVSDAPALLPLPPKSRQWLKRQQALRKNGNGKDGVHAET